MGPAGGAALRTALVGKKAASAAAVTKAIPSGKALVTTTDLAADLVGQPALGAIDAAIQGENVGLGAAEGIGAAGAAAGVEALSGGSAGTTMPGFRGTAVAAGKAFAKQGIKALAASGGAETIERTEVPRPEEEF